MSSSDHRIAVACLGSSSTAAKGCYDWIKELESRHENREYRFLNFGVGGDLAFNALQRLPGVLQHRPGKLIVLIGGNDALTATSPKFRRFLGWWKRIPELPSAAWYETNLRRIVDEARRHSAPEIALCSLVPIGERPDSDEPFQQRINSLIRDYSAIIQRVAAEEGVAYIPVYERIMEQIHQSPGPALKGVRVLSLYVDAILHFVLSYSFDQLAARNGWLFHTDGIHLNSRGGRILADVIQEFLKSPTMSKRD